MLLSLEEIPAEFTHLFSNWFQATESFRRDFRAANQDINSGHGLNHFTTNGEVATAPQDELQNRPGMGPVSPWCVRTNDQIRSIFGSECSLEQWKRTSQIMCGHSKYQASGEKQICLWQRPLKRILLIDRDDLRRTTRVLLLQKAGYEVVTADSFEDVEGHIREAAFDLVIVETDNVVRDSIAYGQRLRGINPRLPILLLSGEGLFFPKNVLLSSFAAAQPSPVEVMTRIAALLLESKHQRED